MGSSSPAVKPVPMDQGASLEEKRKEMETNLPPIEKQNRVGELTHKILSN
jgi:hypothetical protein